MTEVVTDVTIINLCDSSDDDSVHVIDPSGNAAAGSSVGHSPDRRIFDSEHSPSSRRTLSTMARKRKARRSLSDRTGGSSPGNGNHRKRSAPLTPSGRNDSPGEESVEIVSVKKTSTTPITQILEVFPDVDPSHAKKLLKDCAENVAMVLSILSDGSYPKHEESKNTSASSSGGLALSFERLEESKYDYLSKSSFTPSQRYMSESLEQLKHEFPFMNRNALIRSQKQAEGHYSIVREQILDTLMGKNTKSPPGHAAAAAASSATSADDEEEKYYHAVMPVMAGSRPNTNQLHRLGSGNIVKRHRHVDAPNIADPILKEEVEYAHQKTSRWMEMIEERLKRKSARLDAQRAGTAVECTCCFEQVAMEEMTSCEAGHLLCVDCLKSYSESMIFGSGNFGMDSATGKPALELKCCHGDGCNSTFSDSFLRRVLPPKALEKYNELQFRMHVEKAGIGEDMFACPKCGFEVDMPSTLMVFECPIISCRHHCCRKCGKAPHIPLRCEEVAKQKVEDEGRLKVEEAISAAKIRRCPKCKSSFIKQDGCNKVACPCGRKVCYICQKDITREMYKHFCQTPHCKHKDCGKCLLYTNADEDDKRAMREAGVTAAERFKEQVREEDPSASAKVDIELDVDKILGSDSNGKKKSRRK